MITQILLPEWYHSSRLAMTSIPWPAERKDTPVAQEVASQTVTLFQPYIRPRLRRYLLLVDSGDSPLPNRLAVGAADAEQTDDSFSTVEIVTKRENLDSHNSRYVYRECEARLQLRGDRHVGIRMGLLPNTSTDASRTEQYSWWQWCSAERLWSGRLAEAWRIGGHLVPYTVETAGQWDQAPLGTLGTQLQSYCGDILHGDLFLIVWRCELIQATAHFKSCYLHAWPKPVPAFPVVQLSGLRGSWCDRTVAAPTLLYRSDGDERDVLDFSPSRPMFTASHPAQVRRLSEEELIVQPWSDLRILGNKTRDDQMVYLEPARADVLPAGVSRSFSFNIGLGNVATDVARYRVEPSWYCECGMIETARSGDAARMAQRSTALIREHTQSGGIDTGRVWRYLRRDLRSGVPQEDGPEWEGNLAQAMFTLAAQCGEDPSGHWPLYLHQAYHAADVAVYHGSWMSRLECSPSLSAPLSKHRIGGFLFGYLETGDPYLLEIARATASVYMAMEWGLQPRSAMGRDSYPIASLMSLWDYTAEPLYLDFARQTMLRLLSTQQPDGGFSGQAGAGVLSGISARPAVEDIHFGNGVLAPVALLEWAGRDHRWPVDFMLRLRRWADLMLRLQSPSGQWHTTGRTAQDKPYPLTGSVALFTLVKAAQILGDQACVHAAQRYLGNMSAQEQYVSGTHAFLSALYAHVADAVFE